MNAEESKKELFFSYRHGWHDGARGFSNTLIETPKPQHLVESYLRGYRDGQNAGRLCIGHEAEQVGLDASIASKTINLDFPDVMIPMKPAAPGTTFQERLKQLASSSKKEVRNRFGHLIKTVKRYPSSRLARGVVAFVLETDTPESFGSQQTIVISTKQHALLLELSDLGGMHLTGPQVRSARLLEEQSLATLHDDGSVGRKSDGERWWCEPTELGRMIASIS